MDVNISKFLWETSVESSKLNVRTVHAVVAQVSLMERIYDPVKNEDSTLIATLSGSASELHINTPMSCVNDVDIMFHSKSMVLIPEAGKIPTHLPPEFGDLVVTYEMVDSQQHTGYVYVDWFGLLLRDRPDSSNNNWPDESTQFRQDKYEIIQTKFINDSCVSFRLRYIIDSTEDIGPAKAGSYELVYNNALDAFCGSSVASDYVWCIRCPAWPLQAADWPKRHRSHGWPDVTTVERVVNGGCDVVRVSHRHNKEDRLQHRLSFSRAETVLLNSYTKSQQIVYHMLRYITKMEHLAYIRDTSGHKVFSGYHIKTLLLWACELKPQNWWTDHRKLLSMCRHLLRTLVVWLREGDVQHYFVKGWKLYPEDSEVESTQNKTIIARLESVIDNQSQWFYDNYIYLYVRREANPDICRTFYNAKTADEKRSAICDLTQFRNECLHGQRTVIRTQVYITDSIINAFAHRHVTIDTCSFFVRGLAGLDKNILSFLYAVLFANTVDYLENDRMTQNSDLNILYTALLLHDCTHAHVDADVIRSQSISNTFHKATMMMRAANKPGHLSSVKRIQLEMVKACLHNVLLHGDSDVNASGLRCLSHVYLAALYYATGHHLTAIDHCNMVTAADNHSQCTSRVVEGRLLPQIDVNIDNVLGLVALYEFIEAAALNQQQLTRGHLAVFTTELFVCYLHLTALSAVDKQPSELQLQTLQRFTNMFASNHPSHVTDLLLIHVYSVDRASDILRKVVGDCGTCEIFNLHPPFSSVDLRAALRQSAVDSMKKYRKFQQLECLFDDEVDETVFSAICHLFCGQYEQCLTICHGELSTLLKYGIGPSLTVEMQIISMRLVLLKCDLVLILGLAKLYNQTLFLKGDSPHKLAYLCGSSTAIFRHTLLLYIYTESQMKMKLPSRCLVKTLKAVGNYYTEFSLEFGGLNINRPYSIDGVLLKFLDSKIRQYINQHHRKQISGSEPQALHLHY